MNVIKNILNTKAYRNINALRRIKKELPELLDSIDLKFMKNNDLLNEKDKIIKLLNNITEGIYYELSTLDLNLTPINHTTIDTRHVLDRILDNQSAITTLENNAIRVNNAGTSYIRHEADVRNNAWHFDEQAVLSRINNITYSSNTTH